MPETTLESLPSRVVVTGAGGFVGRHVVAQLANQGVEVRAVLGRGHHAPPALAAETFEADLTNLGEATAALDGFGGVVHLAARSGGVATQDQASVFADNRALTDSVLEAVKRVGTKRIFLASSGVVYRDSPNPINEDDPLLGPNDRPNQYAWSKICDEVAAQWAMLEGSVEVVIGRPGNVIGPVDATTPARTTAVYDIIRRATELKPGEPLEIWGDGSAVRSFVHVEDAARAIITAFASGDAGDAYNIDSGESLSIGKLAKLVRDLVAPTAQLAFDPDKPSGPKHRALSVDKLKALGYVPQWGVSRTVDEIVRTPQNSA